MGIPGELSDKIIDVLRDDKATLLSCSLVSKNWTLRSQYHLFKTVTIVCPSVEEQFAFVEWLHHSDSEHLRMFLRTLKIQTEFTKNLRITRYHLNTGRIRQEFLRFDALERMLRQLPNLDRLELRGMYWIQRDPGGLLRSLNLPGGVDSVIKPLPPFPQVTSLVISGAQSPWMLPDLYYIFDFFPSLKNLRLEHSLELIMEGREGDPGFPEHIRLDTLQIDGVCSISWDSVFPSSALMNLRELRIQPTWAIRPLVDKCLSSVKTLWLGMYSPPPQRHLGFGV
ncbi:hypothetical protein BXZ70DRAFT_921855 [Cristinia sonorae]|uniref:F-box domain-containing protein n=1 Tax=Cristinia sonorae TaxID=1940300 RepID=A0A8K0UVH5_9AGAR|nr:hypothetical protein BXZ70DRAFT_921855 [Cristinia sonorae]